MMCQHGFATMDVRRVSPLISVTYIYTTYDDAFA